jgi:hypothetical protein
VPTPVIGRSWCISIAVSGWTGRARPSTAWSGMSDEGQALSTASTERGGTSGEGRRSELARGGAEYHSPNENRNSYDGKN